MTTWRERVTRILPFLTAALVLVQLLSLRLPLLRGFFYDTLQADVQGIDYFSLPKAWLNLQAGRSLYGTFDPPAYGPHFTWYLAHPVLAIALGGPLSRLQPMDSYGVFTLLSVAVMAACAWLLARETSNPLHRRLIWLLLLGSFPGFLMLWVGNVQAFTVLGLTLVLVGIQHIFKWKRDGPWLLRAGLLLSLFTKPVVLLLFPLLLLLRETRRSAFDALAVYVPVSLLCQTVPELNPERISLGRIFWLGWHPGFVRSHMNLYANGLRLTPDMRDNSIHWFNLVAQSGYRLQHIDVDSLPVFLDGLLGARTSGWLYLLPTLTVLALSLAVPRLREGRLRRDAALLLVMAASLDFFVAYPTVWEYQYTAVLPITATLLVRGPGLLGSRRVWLWALALGACAWLPSLYIFSQSASPSMGTLALVRLDRVLPVVALFVLLLWTVVRAVRTASVPAMPAVAATV